jgi:hypothetical protein
MAYVTKTYSLALSSKGSFEEVSDKAALRSGDRASSRSSISSSKVSRRDKTFVESILPGWEFVSSISGDDSWKLK